MIITKTPFRISFAGGGSDVPAFYEEHGGCVLSTTINKYIFITIHPYFHNNQTLLKYSQNELVNSIDEIQHSIFHCVLKDMGIHGVEIGSTADVPSGTGLGSSSTFTVGLLHSLYSYQGKFASKEKLAREACMVELEKLNKPIGKQDQYAAAYGGLKFYRFNQDGSVSVEPILMKSSVKKELEENLVMYYTGVTHDATEILKEQSSNSKQQDKVENLKKMCGLAESMRESLNKNDISRFGEYLHEGWMLKKELASSITNSSFDEIYQKALQNGAVGGKLLGAGGGGFFLFYCPKEKQEALTNALGLRKFDFAFENDGASIVYIGDKYWD